MKAAIVLLAFLIATGIFMTAGYVLLRIADVS